MTTVPALQAEVIDVWSRAASKYRIRAALMLLILAALFAGLCCFTFWLRTGVLAPWESDSYLEILRDSFRPTGINQITLSDFLSRPIPVQEVPVHALIMGILFASLCSIPILVSILYRLPFSVLFAAMVFSLAAMPWLGITVLIGCTLASMGQFRFRFRYASALIGLTPTAIYFVTASWQPAGTVSAMSENQALVYAPWVLAMLSSCIICAVALAIARIINFRPGGMPPVLALLFAVPVMLFHVYVGRDELEYRILENQFGRSPNSAFSPVDIGQLARQAATARWSDTGSGSYDALYEEIYRNARSSVLERMEQKRLDATISFDRFTELFPQSRRVPDVLFLKARALDMRVDLARLESSGQAQFRSDMPSAASRQTWQTLIERFPTYPGTATALHRLAILSASDGDIANALRLLETLVRSFNSDTTDNSNDTQPESVVGSAFKRTPRTPELQIDVLLNVERAQSMREMLLICRDDKPLPYVELFGARADGSNPLILPVQLLLRLDRVHPAYARNLRHIASVFPDSHAAGFVAIREAEIVADERAQLKLLRDTVDRLSGRPECAEALFALADALLAGNRIDEAERLFEQILETHSESEWARRARARLTALEIVLIIDAGGQTQ
ncbi:MAG: tetratricopeptide repeat protein [Phycisphaerae bacterium]|nr:tetratricopeptide repeat protein [Phycisphaerae bacterium]